MHDTYRLPTPILRLSGSRVLDYNYFSKKKNAINQSEGVESMGGFASSRSVWS